MVLRIQEGIGIEEENPVEMEETYAEGEAYIKLDDKLIYFNRE